MGSRAGLDVYEERNISCHCCDSNPRLSSPVANQTEPSQAHAPAMNQIVSPTKFSRNRVTILTELRLQKARYQQNVTCGS